MGKDSKPKEYTREQKRNNKIQKSPGRKKKFRNINKDKKKVQIMVYRMQNIEKSRSVRIRIV